MNLDSDGCLRRGSIDMSASREHVGGLPVRLRVAAGK